MNTKTLPTISKLPAAFIHIGCRRKLSASTYVCMYIPITILNLTWHYEYLMRKVKGDHCPKGNELICQFVIQFLIVEQIKACVWIAVTNTARVK